MLADLVVLAQEYISLKMLLVVLPLGYLVINEIIRYKARIKGMTGPPNIPFVGHLPWIRLRDAPEQYRKWSEKYGPMYQVQLGNVPVVVVNNSEYANKMFITHNHQTMTRPMFHTFHKVVSSTAGFTIGTSPYDESLKRRRKAAAGALNRPNVQKYVPLIDREVVEFLREAFKSNAEPMYPKALAQRLSLNLGLTLNWGTRLDLDDPMFQEITDVEELVSRTRSTTGNLQDYVPFLRMFAFRQNANAAELRRRRDVYLKRLNKDLEEKMEKNTHKPCIQANVLRDPEAKLDAAELMSISLTMIAGGFDTITSLVEWSMPLLAMRTDIQEKAYKAIREHTDELLPDPTEDQGCLYIAALVKELLRMYTPVRLSLPKAAYEDFWIDGKFIPKGTPLFLNSFACNMDPEKYSNPREFNPDRFVEDFNQPQYAYGFGVRMCTGYMLANRELYVLYMRLISAFEIVPVEKIDVDPVTGTHDPTTLAASPRPHHVKFVPRDRDALKKALDEHVPVTV